MFETHAYGTHRCVELNQQCVESAESLLKVVVSQNKHIIFLGELRT